MEETKKSGTSLTALRALNTLEIVAESNGSVSAQEVAGLLGADKVTAYRMLVTLEAAGYVVRDETSKRYSLSYKVVSLSRNLLAENEVSKLILEELRGLSRATEETLHYAVLDGHETVLVKRVKGTQLVNVDFQIGDRSPLHCTSIGKALLAFQDMRFIEEVIAAGLPGMTVRTITDPDALRLELRTIRSQGFAFDDHEFSDSMRCVAVPVFEAGGRVHGGISISGPDSRFSMKKLHELRDHLMDASRRLSRHLGGLPWHE